MDSQQFLLINILFVAVMIIIFMMGRSNAKKPTPLKMKSNSETVNSQIKNSHQQKQQVKMLEELKSKIDSTQGVTMVLEPERAEANPLRKKQIIFNYNGHSWEAYEVFGISAGSSLAEVTQAYQKTIQQCDPTSLEFFKTAYQTILSRYS